MTVHIMVLLYMCFMGCIVYRTRMFQKADLKKKNKVFLIYAEICLFLVCALRSYQVGLDGPTYYAYYRALIKYPGFRTGWEPIYLLINQIALKLNWYQFVIISTSLITCLGFGYFAYHNCDDRVSAFWFVYFFITLNLYFTSMNLIRQICSMAICINVYTVLKKDQTRIRYIKSLALMLLGLGFHIMAVLSIIYAIPFIIKKVDKKTIVYAIVVSLVGIATMAVGQRFIIRVVPRFSRYINDDRLVSSRAGFFSLVMIALKLILIVITLTLNSKRSANQEIYRLTFLTVFGTAFYILQFRTQFALRIGYYFEIFFLVYIPSVINKMSNKHTRFILYAGLFLFGAIYFIYMMTWGGVRSNRGCVPYLFFWQ